TGHRRTQLGLAPRRDHRRGRRLDRARPRPRTDRPRALRLDRGAVRRLDRVERVRAAPPPAADPRHRPGAQRRLRRGRCDRMPAACGRAPRSLRPQARPVRVEAREPVRRQHRHGLDAAAARQHATLLQRRRGRRDARHGVAAVPVSRAGADHPVRRCDRRVREVHRPHRERGHREAVRAVALIDGEHYPSVVRDALAALPYHWVGAILVGGTEKLRDDPEYGIPLVTDFGDAEIVVDLSDEPVLGPIARFEWASRALAAGLPYAGADFRFDPPELPSIAVIGTGKRVGKTAVTTELARLLARDRSVVVVAMGRGGPSEPELVESAPTIDELVERSRAGRHAASDHLEIAALAGVPTIGCRRAGGGLAGAVSVSNVAEGARLAAELRPDIVVFDGSGAAIPPVAV